MAQLVSVFSVRLTATRGQSINVPEFIRRQQRLSETGPCFVFGFQLGLRESYELESLIEFRLSRFSVQDLVEGKLRSFGFVIG